MKMSKERVVYAAVLGCGLVLLVLDRAIFAPAGADAAPTDDYSVQKADDDTAPIAMPETDASGSLSLATRLSADSPDWQQNLRNGFIVSEQWIPPPPPPEQAATTPEQDLAAALPFYEANALPDEASMIAASLAEVRAQMAGGVLAL